MSTGTVDLMMVEVFSYLDESMILISTLPSIHFHMASRRIHSMVSLGSQPLCLVVSRVLCFILFNNTCDVPLLWA